MKNAAHKAGFIIIMLVALGLNINLNKKSSAKTELIVEIKQVENVKSKSTNVPFVVKDPKRINNASNPSKLNPVDSKKSRTAPQIVKAKYQHTIDFNVVSKNELVESGMNKWVAENLKKYQLNGGKIYSKSDLLKIYNIDETWIKSNEDLMVYQEKPKRNERKKRKYEPRVIEINLADSSDWLQLKGIGPSYSKRILKFREALGGFYDVNQISEVYGMPDSLFNSIKPYLMITTEHEKISLDQMTEKQLAKHPYVNYKESKLIHSFVNQRPAFKVSDLDDMLGVDQEKLKKLLPYLKSDTEDQIVVTN